MGAHGEIEITITADKAQAAIDALASHANKGADRIASHERQVMSQLALERKRFVAEGLANEVAALDQVVAMRKKAYDYKSQGFSQERATGMARQEVLYDTEIAAKQKAVELAKNIEASQASLNAQKLRELETAKQIAEKQASIASSNAKEQAAIQKKIQLMAAVASGDKQREQHLRAMAALERNVQLGLNAGLKPSEALQQARTMLRLEQSISQEKQKQQSIGGGPGGAAYAGARRGSAFSGGQNAAYRTGMISQQAQDVAVSLQMGMSASRVIAQQGSQIASIFGPKGMVIGGVIAIGAAMWEFASGTEKAARRAKELEDHIREMASINAKTKAIAAETAASIAAREGGAVAGSLVSANEDYQRKMQELRDKEVDLNRERAQKMQGATIGLGLPNFDSAERRRISAEYDAKKSALEKQRIEIRAAAEESGIEINARGRAAYIESITESKNSAALSDARAREESEADRQKTEDLQRELNFISKRNSMRDSSRTADQKNREYGRLADARMAEIDEVSATRKRKRDEDAAAVYLKSAEEQVKMTADKAKAEKDTAQFRDTSVQKYIRTQSELAALEKDYGMGGLERETKISEKKLELRKQEEGAIREIESMQREGAEFAKAGLSGSDSQNKRKAIEMEIDLLNKKKAFSPIEAQQIANKIELLRREQVSENFNMGALGAGGMGAFNRNRKAEERAQDRAEQRALGNMGLIDIVRGAGNSVVSGVDPVTGRRLSGKELEARKADMAAEKARRDMERKAAAGDKEAQERLKRVRWGNEQNGNDGKIAAGFSADQIKFLSTSIADAVKELITK